MLRFLYSLSILIQQILVLENIVDDDSQSVGQTPGNVLPGLSIHITQRIIVDWAVIDEWRVHLTSH